jgi:plasmid stability protein
MEEEARAILRSALTSDRPVQANLAEAIKQRFAGLGGIKLKLPRRDGIRRPPSFPE